MEVKPGYKQSEAGIVPVDWEVRQLGDLASVSAGGTPSRDRPHYWDGDIPWVTTSEVDFSTILSANQFITQEGLKNSPAKLLPPGTLLMALYGQGKTRGKIGVLGIEAATNQACAAISLHRNVSPEFIYYCLSSQYDVIRGLSNSGGQENLNSSIVRSISISLPPLSEQRAIAEALSDVDGLLGALDRLIAKKRDLKQAAMQQLLTGQTRLPGFSGDWEKSTLGELVSFLSGGTPSRSNDNYWTGDIPWISASSLRCFEIWRSDSNVTKEAVAAGSRMAPVGASLLLVRGSALHNEILCGLVTRPVCFNQDVKALVPNSRVVPRFLTLFIKGTSDQFLKLVSSAGNTAGVLDTKLLRAFAIDLPKRDEQTAIAEVLSGMDAELAALEQRREKTRALKQGMMQELLTGRTRLVNGEGRIENGE